MSVVDFAIVAIVLISLLVGMFRGFIREALSLASWIVALWVAYLYATAGATYLEAHINQLPLRVTAAFTAIFVVALIGASVVSHLLCRLFAVSGISGLDRSLGLLFGAGRGALIVAALILAAIFMDMAAQPWWRESLLVAHFTPLTDLLRSLMPQEVAVYFQSPQGGG